MMIEHPLSVLLSLNLHLLASDRTQRDAFVEYMMMSSYSLQSTR